MRMVDVANSPEDWHVECPSSVVSQPQKFWCVLKKTHSLNLTPLDSPSVHLDRLLITELGFIQRVFNKRWTEENSIEQFDRPRINRLQTVTSGKVISTLDNFRGKHAGEMKPAENKTKLFKRKSTNICSWSRKARDSRRRRVMKTNQWNWERHNWKADIVEEKHCLNNCMCASLKSTFVVHRRQSELRSHSLGVTQQHSQTVSIHSLEKPCFSGNDLQSSHGIFTLVLSSFRTASPPLQCTLGLSVFQLHQLSSFSCCLRLSSSLRLEQCFCSFKNRSSRWWSFDPFIVFLKEKIESSVNHFVHCFLLRFLLSLKWETNRSLVWCDVNTIFLQKPLFWGSRVNNLYAFPSTESQK